METFFFYKYRYIITNIIYYTISTKFALFNEAVFFVREILIFLEVIFLDKISRLVV